MATTIKFKRTGNEATAISVANAKSLLYSEPAYCSANKKLYIGSESGDGSAYGEFVSIGADTNYATAAQGTLADSSVQPGDDISVLTNNSGYLTDITGENLGDLSDVTAAVSSDDGKVLSYVHGAGTPFQWIVQDGNTDVDVSTSNLLTKLAALDNSADIVIGDATDTKVVIAGDLQINGTTTTVSSSTLTVADLNIVVAEGAADKTAANLAGLTIDMGSDPSSKYQFKSAASIGGTTDRFINITDKLQVTSIGTSSATANVAVVEIFGSSGAELYMRTDSTSQAVITDTEWTGDNIVESKITGAQFTNWNTAYTDRLKWDGGATGLTAATGRASLGLGNAAVVDIGTTSGTAAEGNHLHTGVYSPVGHQHAGSDITGTLDGGTF